MPGLAVAEMRLDGRPCPVFADTSVPSFSWKFDDATERFLGQVAYRIEVSSRPGGLEAGKPDMWDSGRVESARSTDVRYAGLPLRSATRYYWRVTVWDNAGRASASPVAWWETGLFSPDEWKAMWIGKCSRREPDDRAMPLFRREFDVRAPLVSARIYICGLGHYELRLNGGKVGDSVLEPGWTNYDRTCFYQVYDVTDRLVVGKNAVGVMLGNGFYNVEGGRYAKFKRSFGVPKCLVQIRLVYEDGTTELVVSDRTWKTADGPIRFSCIYGGEDYDARLEQPGWDEPGFREDERWTEAVSVEPPAGVLRLQPIPPLKVMRRFRPVGVSEPKPGVCVFDLGQNFSGWVRIVASGPKGASIVLKPAERLRDGLACQRDSGAPYRFEYTLKGEGREEWTPRFSYYGFRYVQVEGAVPEAAVAETSAGPETGRPVLHELEGEMIVPDTPVSGGIETSDAMLNAVHRLIDAAVLSNMKSVFTDCPHREKLGWLEQLHLMGPSIIYNHDVLSLLAKAADDMADAQLPDGMVPTTAPEYVVFREPWDVFRHSVPWGASYLLVPLMLYRMYGDRRALERHYEGMVRYLDFLGRLSENGMIHKGLGDWYDVGPDRPGFSQNTPVAFVETAYYYHLLDAACEIASLLGRPADADMFRRRAESVRKTINDTFFDRDAGVYATGSQTAQALAYAFGLAGEFWRPSVLERLREDVARRGYHTTAGDVGHRYVLLALSSGGCDEDIFRMTRNTDHPSYGYQIVHGATTLTEAWNGPTVGASQNHFMLGHLQEWLYAGLAGIRYRFDPADGRFRADIRPRPVGDVRWVRAWHDIPPGRIRVCWERVENAFRLEVDIPPNVDAMVRVPTSQAALAREIVPEAACLRGAEFVGAGEGVAVFRVGSGRYTFESECWAEMERM